MVRCPKCNREYGAEIERCPADGTVLAALGSVSGVERTAVAATSQAVGQSVAAAPVDAPAPDALSPGDTVGEYQITGKLGEGGMGTVYAGVHPVIGKRVAVKVLSAVLSQDASIVQRFVQEARSVNQIGHRNIIDIFSFGRLKNGQQYFVMEFLPGQSLRERLAAGPISYGEGFAILLEVADALVAAHSEGIVHRDLKPDNIYLAESKSGERTVKLLDFGIAKLTHVTDSAGEVQKTRTGVPMGTPLYMSPEQCLGRAVDARTDLYALGVIMFELFTGALPFPGPSYIETVNGHLSQPPPRPTTLAEIPDSLEALILKCLEKDAARRPQSMVEVRTSLQEIARELGAEVSGRMSGVHGAVSASTPARRTPLPPEPTPAPASKATRSPALLYAAIGIGTAAVVGGAIFALRHRQVTVARPPAIVAPAPAPTPAAQRPSAVVNRAAPVVAPSHKAESAPAGRLKVAVNAHQAEWTLDGRPVGDGSGVFQIESIPTGSHTLRVAAKGFEPHEEQIEIHPYERAVFQWVLIPERHHAGHASKHAAKPTSKGAAPQAAGAADDDATWPPK